MTRRRWLLAAVLALAAALALLLLLGRDPDGRGVSAARATVDRDADGRRARLAAIARRRAGLDAALPRLTLQGRVVDGDDRPVAGATVVLAQGARAIASAADGGFVFDGLLPGVYAIEARAGARVGGPRRIVLSPSSAREPVILRLYRGAVAEVEVVDAANGRPVPGAEVRIWQLSMYPDAGRQIARTDERGVARFEGATIVAHSVLATAPGFAPAEDTLDPATQHGGRWRLRVELTAGARVAGRVVDEAGAPIAGATVEVRQGGGDDDSPRQLDPARHGAAHPLLSALVREGVVTDADGAFEVALPEGRWALAATHPGHEPAVSPTLVSNGRTPSSGLTLVLGAGRRVTGVVVDAEDRPVAGAEIEVRWSFASRIERRARSDGTGRFEVKGLPPGKLALLALADGAASSPEHVDLSDGDPEEEVILVLAHDGVITGVVRDSAGRPIPDAQIFYAEIAKSERAARVHPSVVTADARGAFTVRGVARDPAYSLTAMRPQDGDHFFRQAGVIARAGDHVEVVVPDDGALVGTITVGRGRPPRGTAVEVAGMTEPRVVGSDGRFRIAPLPPGRYQLVVTGPGVPRFTVDDVDVVGGGDTDAGTIDVPRGRTVAGRVQRGDGRPVAGADVTIAAEGGVSVTALAGGDGRFSTVAPAEVPLRIRAQHRGGRISDLVEVPPDGDATRLTIVLGEGGTIEGDVHAGDEPLAEQYVSVRVPDSDPQVPPLAMTETDGAGYFKLKGVPAGEYIVELHVVDEAGEHPTYYPRTVQLAEGATLFVQFDTTTDPGVSR